MKKIIFRDSKFESMKTINRGRGVFAGEQIKKGEEIESCPVLILPISQEKHLEKTELKYYYFEWAKDKDAIALGYGSLYNHSYKPNAEFLISKKDQMIVIKALTNIKKGEEIFFDYNGHNPSGDCVWFKVK
ncbi:MAG: SET domain-containing protein [bacterium]|nr:SET domain-containing protein [bacterium]